MSGFSSEITVILVSSTSTVKSDSVDISSDRVSAISDFSCSGITSGITIFSASTESLISSSTFITVSTSISVISGFSFSISILFQKLLSKQRLRNQKKQN
jgi:hypothetical protein